MIQLRKVLCPIDLSVGSREALLRAAEIAAKNSSELVVVHVFEPPIWLGLPNAQVAAEGIQQLVESEYSTLEDALAEAHTLGVSNVTSRMLSGSTAEAIVEEARNDPSIDLIVMGTHGRTGLRHMVLGSVAETVVRLAPCDVLVTRRRDPAPLPLATHRV